MQGSSHTCAITAIALAIAAVSSVLTLLLSRYLYTATRCNAVPSLPTEPTKFSNKPSWDGSERIVIDEKKVIVIRLHNKNRCYIAPLDETPVAQRKLELINEELGDNLIEQIAGVDALRFCQHQQTFLLKEPNSRKIVLNRSRRQADMLNIPIEKRTPNCMDILLDCGRQIGEINVCYTWINGVMAMQRECRSDNEFKVTLTRPKGRIMEIQREQWEICVERRKKGLRC